MLLTGRHHRGSRPLSFPIAEESVSLAGRQNGLAVSPIREDPIRIQAFPVKLEATLGRFWVQTRDNLFPFRQLSLRICFRRQRQDVSEWR